MNQPLSQSGIQVPTLEEFNTLRSYVYHLGDRIDALEGLSGEQPEPQRSHTLVGTSVPWGNSIEDMAEQLGGISIRRVYDSNVPASYSSSSLRHDNGERWQVWSFKPNFTRPETHDFRTLFESIPNRSKVYVVPYHEPVDNMSAAQYRQLYDAVHDAYEEVGGFAGIGTCLTNYSITQLGALAFVQPDKSGFLSVDIYAELGPGPPFPNPVNAMRQAIDYANQHNLPFAVDEFGVDLRKSVNPDHLQEQLDWVFGFRQLIDYTDLNRLVWWSGSVSNMYSHLLSDPRQSGGAEIRQEWKDLRDYFEIELRHANLP